MSAFDLQDTIAAIASPTGPAPRGIVRITGPAAWTVATACFEPALDQPARVSRSVVGQYALEGLASALPASLLFWPGPRTYTGMPLAEAHTVGSAPLLQLLLATRLQAGARLAEPGEFTLRAFLNGRIDLTQAEAVLGVIDARSRSQLDMALGQLAGGLAARIGGLRGRLLDLLALLEAGLDFVDEPDVVALDRPRLAIELASASDELQDLAQRMAGRDRAEGRPRVVLVGPPNAGKSRLFNVLSAGEHAIVSPAAGTTRDYLIAACRCADLWVDLIDTAGTEAASTPIGREAQRRRDEVVATADLLLLCLPCDQLDPSEIVAGRPDVPTVHVHTKSDLLPPCASPGPTRTSALTGEGTEALRATIAARLGDAPGEMAVAATSARCRDSLAQAGDALKTAARSATLGAGDELIALDLRLALDELGKVVGAIVTDDVLDRIFARFCIGK